MIISMLGFALRALVNLPSCILPLVFVQDSLWLSTSYFVVLLEIDAAFYLESISNTFFSFADFHHDFLQRAQRLPDDLSSKDENTEEGLLFLVDRPIFG